MNQVTTRFKQPRMKNRKYLDSYQSAECVVCGNNYGVIGAHIRTGHEGGTGRKPDDDLTLPLCFEHHQQQEASPGPKWWLDNIVKPMARQRYQEWLADNAYKAERKA